VIRPSSLGLIVLCAIIPLYGTLADSIRPGPIPRVVPDGVATDVGVVLAALVAIAGGRPCSPRDALTSLS